MLKMETKMKKIFRNVPSSTFAVIPPSMPCTQRQQQTRSRGIRKMQPTTEQYQSRPHQLPRRQIRALQGKLQQCREDQPEHQRESLDHRS